MKSCDKCVCALLHSCVASPITVVCRHAGAGEGVAEEQAALRQQVEAAGWRLRAAQATAEEQGERLEAARGRLAAAAAEASQLQQCLQDLQRQKVG